mgnify:CR=1 FL=1
MIAFIDDHRAICGVEPICRVLPIAPSTYHAHLARHIDPTKASARAQRDAALKAEIRRVFEANFCVYGVRKVWRQLGRLGAYVSWSGIVRADESSFFDFYLPIRNNSTSQRLPDYVRWVRNWNHGRAACRASLRLAPRSLKRLETATCTRKR